MVKQEKQQKTNSSIQIKTPHRKLRNTNPRKKKHRVILCLPGGYKGVLTCVSLVLTLHGSSSYLFSSTVDPLAPLATFCKF